MLELNMSFAALADGREAERDPLPGPKSARTRSEVGARLVVGRDPTACRPLLTPHDWLFVSRRHLVFEYSEDRGWTVEWPRGQRDTPVAIVRIKQGETSQDVPYGAILPLSARTAGTITVSDLARRRSIVLTWRAVHPLGGRGVQEVMTTAQTMDEGPGELRRKLSGVRLEVLAGMSCDWIHGRPTKRPRTTDELCEMLYMAKATVERCKTELRRDFYSSELCPELNDLLGPDYLDTTPHVHGGWDLIAQTAVTCGIVGREPCPCARRGGSVD
ncbi:hypothetical protein [Embleya sp. NBC_00896]|uniref:hypothetical protein n=1 Tax=Embleya sp. NBC_00896 TaxID=2975961 RepID=UPI00386E0A23|nr:hypothetical protein OG928_10975 [Embleya sp. NBC_00896]